MTITYPPHPQSSRRAPPRPSPRAGSRRWPGPLGSAP